MTSHITTRTAELPDISQGDPGVFTALHKQYYRGSEIAPVYKPGFAEGLARAGVRACVEADKAGYRAVCVYIAPTQYRKAYRDVYVKRGGVWQPAKWLYGKQGKIDKNDDSDLHTERFNEPPF